MCTDLYVDVQREYVNVSASGSVVQQSENGTPEMTESLRYDARYVDADSNGIVENVTISLHAEKAVYGPDGNLVGREWITYDYSGQDRNQDGTMDNVSLVFEKHVTTSG